MSATLPREILKWLQGLDLSYSVKDVKRDLSNGFLIAEVLSRYFPGDMVPMYSFDNSQKLERRQNNWQLLERIFQKNGIPFKKREYADIIENNDSAVLIDFMIKLYAGLTGKKINRNAFVNIQNFNKSIETTGKQGDFHQSFLLKDRGMEKLQDIEVAFEEKKISESPEKTIKDNKNSPNPKMVTSSLGTSQKLKTFLKYEQKPISQRPEVSNLKFEVKNINVRPVNINVSKLRATKEAHATLNNIPNATTQVTQEIPQNFEKTATANLTQRTNQETTKTQSSKKDKLVEKSIYDILNEYLNERFMTSSFIGEYQQNFNLKTYPDAITSFSDNFNNLLFKEISDRIDPLANFVVRDMNEAWKFLNFLFNCLKSITIEKEYFKLIINNVRYIGEKLVRRDSEKSSKLLKENFLEVLYNQIAASLMFEKKEHLALTLYSFVPNTAEAKCQIILAFKEIAKDQKIFMQTLVILLSSEKVPAGTLSESDNKYLEFAMKCAKSGIHSSSPVVKTMSLAILANLARMNYHLVLDYVKSKLEELILEEAWEDKCQIIILCSRIIRGITGTETFHNLVRKSTLSFTKNYSWQNEVLANKLKDEVKLFGDAMTKVLQSKPNNSVVRVFIVYCINICGDVKSVMDQIVAILLQSNQQFRDWFFNNMDEIKEEFFIYNDKSLRYQTGFNLDELKRSSKDFVLSLAQYVREFAPPALEAAHFEILEFSLIHTDFKSLNVEVLGGITNLFVPYIFVAFSDSELTETASKLLKRFLTFKLDQDLKISDLEVLFANSLIATHQKDQRSLIDNLHATINWYRDEIDRRKIFKERAVLNEILQNILTQDVSEEINYEIKEYMQGIVRSFETESDENRRY